MRNRPSVSYTLKLQALFFLMLYIVAVLTQSNSKTAKGESISNQHLNNIPLPRAINNFDNVYRLSLLESGKFKPTILNPIEVNFIKEALYEAANEEGLKKLLRNPKFHILIVPESFFMHKFGKKNIQGVYDSPRYACYINEFIVDNLTPARMTQLISILRNELSTALVKETKESRLTEKHCINGMCTAYDSLTEDIIWPWFSDSEYLAVKKAYEEYETHIKQYRTLLDNSKDSLSQQEKKQLEKYSKAVENNYTPLMYGKGAVGFKIEKNTNVDLVKQQRRDAFFNDYDRRAQDINTLYVNKEEQRLAEKISDFDMLPSVVQKTFGSTLCMKMNKFHDVSDYCSRYRKG